MRHLVVLDFLVFSQSIFQGFLSVADVLFLSIFLAGLAGIATKGGGLDFLLSKINKLV